MPNRRALLAYVPAAVAFCRLRRRIGAPPALSAVAAAGAPVAVLAALPRGREGLSRAPGALSPGR